MSLPARGALLAALALASLSACKGTPPVEPTPRPSPPATPTVAAPAPPPNRLMGGGQFREPEPFTIELRLLDAARRGDRQTIERAFERGAALDTVDDLGRNTVFLAVLDAGDLDLVRWLHGRGVRLDDPDTGGRTALSFAAAHGRLDIVVFLVDNGAVVDRRDAQRRTALFHAALNDRPEVASFLLDRGADVNVRDQFDDTPLIVACAKGNASAARLLLQRGADPALKDQEGRTARERAAPGTDPCLAPPPT